jgi:hypothetical protein
MKNKLRRKTMSIRKIITLCLSLIVIGSTLAAAVPFPQNQDIRRVRENVSTFLMLRMTQVLDLTEEQAVKIFPKINQTEKRRNQLNRELGQQIRKLRLVLRDENPDEQEINELYLGIKESKNQLELVNKEFEEFMENNLDLYQRAKYIIFVQDFYRELRERLDKARKQQQNLKNRKRVPLK